MPTNRRRDDAAIARNRALWQKMNDAASDKDRKAALESLFEANLGLVRSAVARYAGQAARLGSREDLDMAGQTGLLEAIVKWNPDRATLGTFAKSYIDGEIRREVCRTEPHYQGETYTAYQQRPKVRAAAEALRAAGNRVTVESVAAAAGVTAETVMLVTRPAPLSLSTPVGDDGDRTIIDVLAEGPAGDGDGDGDLPDEAATARFVDAVPELLGQGIRGRDVIAFALRSGATGRPPAPISDVAYDMARNRGEAQASVNRVSAALARPLPEPVRYSPGADAAAFAARARHGLPPDGDVSDVRLAAALRRMATGDGAAVLATLPDGQAAAMLASVPPPTMQKFLRGIGPDRAGALVAQMPAEAVVSMLAVHESEAAPVPFDGDEVEEPAWLAGEQLVLFG